MVANGAVDSLPERAKEVVVDSGAHFHRCDFQVHTPRDVNWIGPRPTDDAERKAYAVRFVEACRKRGLDAVAITDHHDLAMFPVIRDAALTETDSRGEAISEHDQLVVFPGMELTLGIPCQALLLLDADFPPDLLSALYAKLGVTPTDSTSETHTPPVRLEHITSLVELYKTFGELDYLREKFILLPNVGENGQFSLLRKGFQSHYNTMPCVGGYVDGSLDRLGVGNREILDGKKKEWGLKTLGLFQTSDNRRDDFEELGRHSTWVKWAVPTAEALRQACLARNTRISQEEPQLPAIWIESIQVSNSKFLGPYNLELNPQYNCIIGGRGTGKSTILEYLRWALCDQPPAGSAEDELPDYQSKRQRLIEKTLLRFDAVVTVAFEKNGVRHTVQRNSRTGELSLRIGNGEYDECTEDDVTRLLPIQGFSQKQLSTVGVRQDELSRFVEAPVHQEMSDFANQVAELTSRLRTTYENVQRKRTLQNEVARLALEIGSLESQLPELRKKLKGLTPADQAVLTQHDAYVRENTLLEQWQGELDELGRIVSTATDGIGAFPTALEAPEALPNREAIEGVHQAVANLFSSARGNLSAISDMLVNQDPESPAGILQVNHGKWRKAFDSHTAKYDAVKDEKSANETVVKQINAIEGRIRTLREQRQLQELELGRQGKPEDQYGAARSQWSKLFRDRGTLLKLKCEELTKLSHGRILATLKRGGKVSKAADELLGLVAGTGIRKAKIESLLDGVAIADDPIDHWERLLEELESLAGIELGEGDAQELPATPLLARGNLSQGDIQKLARRLTPSKWLAVSLVELGDQPEFEYVRGDGGADRIAFGDASAGQQATALLTVLLNQKGPPLVIDQPEEDLDNPTMPRIVEELWNAKGNRQAIFVSHNANIVVNGDADLIVCCDYRKAGDQTLGEIKYQGAIDVGPINKEITKVMEGGREAFELR